jgi:glycerol dehydrogenase
MAHSKSVVCIHQRPLIVFASPGRYVQGPGATQELGREMQRLGLQGRVLFIAAGTAKRELASIWQAVLPPVGIEPIVEAFAGECSNAEIERLVQLPVVITPTLASTDSPCSALSVIYNAGGSVEGFRFYNRHPLLVLVDTEVIARAPKRQLVGGIGDALATWFEARTVRESCSTTVVGGLPSRTGTALAKSCWPMALPLAQQWKPEPPHQP